MTALQSECSTGKIPTACLFGGILAGALCLLPIIGVFAPRSLSFLPGVIGLLGFLGHWGVHKARPEIHKPTLYIVSATFALTALSCLWSVNMEMSIERVTKLLSMFLSAVLLISLVKAQGEKFAKIFIRFFIPAVLIGAGLGAFELISDGYFYDTFRGIKYAAKSNLSHLNRSVVFITLLLFPAMIAFKYKDHCCQQKKYILPALLALCVTIIFVLTDSQSSHLAFLFGALAFFVFPVNRPKAWVALWGGIAALLILTPWITQYMFATIPPLVADIRWFQTSYAADRLEIWDFVSRHALQNPLYGFGIEATKAIEEFDTQMLYHKARDVLHPHNFSAQFWIEYGVIGALFLSAFAAYLFKNFQELPLPSRKLALACMIAFMSVAATGYGIWQGWFLGLMITLAAYCVILDKAVSSSNPSSESKHP